MPIDSAFRSRGSRRRHRARQYSGSVPCRRGSMARMISISTARLVLRRWHEDDVALMSAINAHPEVMRWIGDGSVRDEQQTKAAIEEWERQWNRHGFGLFALELRATGELIGFTGLAVPEFLPEVVPAVGFG